MFGRKSETEWGVRVGNKDTWKFKSKGEAEAAVKRMNQGVRGGAAKAKLIQRTKQMTAVRGRPKDTCSGGKCNKRGNVCKKHFRGLTRGKATGSEWSLDGIHKRWDEEGHRWG